MILYDLRCSQDHTFEAWFPDSGAYEEQRAGRQISCPVCGDKRVEKALMAPNIGKAHRDGSGGTPDTKAVAGQVSEQAVKAAFMELRKHVEANADYVGEKFPEEARKIHYGETEQRNIYEAMEEGKEVKKLPMSLGEALVSLDEDEVIKSAMPDEMYRVFEHYKRDEWERFLGAVTEWDLENYMDCLP